MEEEKYDEEEEQIKETQGKCKRKWKKRADDVKSENKKRTDDVRGRKGKREELV